MPEPSSISEFPLSVRDSLPDRLFPTLTPDQVNRSCGISSTRNRRNDEGHEAHRCIARPAWELHHSRCRSDVLQGSKRPLPSRIAMIVNRDDVDLSGADLDANPYQTNADLFERHGEATSDPRRFECVVSEEPKHIVNCEMITHRAHHSGQLTVYLGMNEAPGPDPRFL